MEIKEFRTKDHYLARQELPKVHGETMKMNLDSIFWQNTKYSKVDIEIGAGVGWNAIVQAKKNPDRLLIAFERTQVKFAKFCRRINQHPNLSNLIAIQTNAVFWMARFLPNEFIDNVFLYYPNPQLKNRTQHLRWHRTPQMHVLESKLKVGGKLRFATNLADYALAMGEDMTKVWRFKLECIRSSKASPWNPRTHFEKKYLTRGDECFDLMFEKVIPTKLSASGS